MPQTDGIPDHGAPAAPFYLRAKKLLVAAAGLAAVLVSSGALDGTVETIVSGALALLTAAGVYRAKNETATAHDPNLRA